MGTLEEVGRLGEVLGTALSRPIIGIRMMEVDEIPGGEILRMFPDIVLTNLEDAKEVVNQLYDRIERYDNATIADLLELCNLTSSYNQTRYGWTSKSQIGYKRVSNGYLIDVDESEYLG